MIALIFAIVIALVIFRHMRTLAVALLIVTAVVALLFLFGVDLTTMPAYNAR